MNTLLKNKVNEVAKTAKTHTGRLLMASYLFVALSSCDSIHDAGSFIADNTKSVVDGYLPKNDIKTIIERKYHGEILTGIRSGNNNDLYFICQKKSYPHYIFFVNSKDGKIYGDSYVCTDPNVNKYKNVIEASTNNGSETIYISKKTLLITGENPIK